jgi:hypothetical protein
MTADGSHAWQHPNLGRRPGLRRPLGLPLRRPARLLQPNIHMKPCAKACIRIRPRKPLRYIARPMTKRACWCSRWRWSSAYCSRRASFLAAPARSAGSGSPCPNALPSAEDKRHPSESLTLPRSVTFCHAEAHRPASAGDAPCGGEHPFEPVPGRERRWHHASPRSALHREALWLAADGSRERQRPPLSTRALERPREGAREHA